MKNGIPFENGIYPDISNEDYHAANGVSNSTLSAFSKDQSSLEWQRNCPIDEDKIKTFDFGTATHTITLEPEKMATDFVVSPVFNNRSNDGKAERKAWELENKDRKILTADEYKKLELMRDSIYAHPGAKYWLEREGVSEQSYFWEDPETGLICKCRPDRNVSDSTVLLDVKTTDDIGKFQLYSIFDYRYFVQDPFYCDGVSLCGEEKDTFIFIVIAKTIEAGRYPVRCLTLPKEVIDYGRHLYKQDIAAFHKAQMTGEFDSVYEANISPRFMKLVNETVY